MNLTIFGQPNGPSLSELGLQLLIDIAVCAAIVAVLRFIFAPMNRKVKNKITNVIAPPEQPKPDKTFQDQALGIRCTHCDTTNPAGVTTCIQCGKKLI